MAQPTPRGFGPQAWMWPYLGEQWLRQAARVYVVIPSISPFYPSHLRQHSLAQAILLNFCHNSGVF